jgi:PIN domain nuclease of toxin-antitoxin system
MGQVLLLDTHALIWVTYAPQKLGITSRLLLEDGENEVFVSSVSAFEIANKFRLGKLGEARTLALNFDSAIFDHGFTELPLTSAHARLAGELPIPNRDPFDRMLIAQAQIEQMTLVSNEATFDTFGVQRLW